MLLYGLKNCDTCRKALQGLAQQGRAVVFKDIRAENLSRETIGQWWSIIGAGLLNRRSTTWRNLTETEREGDPIALMQQHPSLIKRPVIVAEDGTVSCGWNRNDS